MNLWETFVHAVSQYFGFLEREFGFRLKTKDSPFIVYGTDKVEVQIYYDIDRFHELDLGIIRITKQSQNEPSIGISEVLQVSEILPETAYMTAYPKDEKSIYCEVQKLASLLHEHGQWLLKADQSVFDRLMKLRKQATQELNSRKKAGAR